MKLTSTGICAALIAMCAPVILTGCGGGTMPFSNGGGNGGGGGNVNRSVREQVIDAVETGFSTYKSGKNSGRARKGRSEDPTSPVTYDYYYELWARLSPGGWNVDYFEDEACTKPAGYARFHTVNEENGDYTATGDIDITAGPKAGSKAISSTSIISSPEYVYTVSHIGTSPGGVEWSTEGRWDASSGFYKSYLKDENGKVFRYECSYKSDGTSRVVFTDENSLEFTLNFNAGQSGNGTITGDDTTLLPATIVWDETASGTITFKDGSTETFENFEFSRQ